MIVADGKRTIVIIREGQTRDVEDVYVPEVMPPDGQVTTTGDREITVGIVRCVKDVIERVRKWNKSHNDRLKAKEYIGLDPLDMYCAIRVTLERHGVVEVETW